ncbi:hypothetical protein [Methylobacterium sp. B4]|uniref:DUF6894 family protein n=1 Tax=Methylobacterium sp. B4 TaxID=1938755 RepID=UPI000D758573|nr:hypothetical protein [Methylobacterium sp. B4]PXW53123.1 hypothetical protein BY998_12663 [Methylobacterium sp. B4]
MVRFFLHLRDGTELIEDPDGSELPDLNAARAEARDAARDIMAGMVRAGELLDGQQIEIRDAAGALLDVVRLKDVLRLT